MSPQIIMSSHIIISSQIIMSPRWQYCWIYSCSDLLRCLMIAHCVLPFFGSLLGWHCCWSLSQLPHAGYRSGLCLGHIVIEAITAVINYLSRSSSGWHCGGSPSSGQGLQWPIVGGGDDIQLATRRYKSSEDWRLYFEGRYKPFEDWCIGLKGGHDLIC